MIDFVALTARQWKLIGGIVIVSIIGTFLAFSSREPQFVATARFSPEGSARHSVLSVAAQYGLGSPTSGEVGETPDFYVQLLESNAILRQAVSSAYHIANTPLSEDTLTLTLAEYYAERRLEPGQGAKDAVGELARHLSASSDLRSGIVTFRVRMPHPSLSEQVARRLLDLVNSFNLATRQSRARQERLFVEERKAEAEATLREAEGELLDFLQSNRQWAQSSELRFQEARLQRRVDLAQQVFVALSRGYENARAEEVRALPVITVVDPPEGTVKLDNYSSPKRILLLGLIVGAVLSAVVILVRARLEEYRRHRPKEYERMETALGPLSKIIPPDRTVAEQANPAEMKR